MLEIIRDNQGNIKACLEWYLVNADGTWNERGDFVWVERIEISSDSNGNSLGYIKEFIKKITDRVPWAKAGYFKRFKYQGRIRLYSKDKWLNFCQGG